MEEKWKKQTLVLVSSEELQAEVSLTTGQVAPKIVYLLLSQMYIFRIKVSKNTFNLIYKKTSLLVSRLATRRWSVDLVATQRQ